MIDKITNYIFMESQPQKANLALIFGTRSMEAVKKAYEIYQEGLVPKILVSGGINKVTGKNEAEEIGDSLIDLGVKKEDLILEKKATNSLENVLFSKDMIEKELGFSNVQKIIAIVKNYHSRRALMTLKKHFPKTVELIPVTYNPYDFTKENWKDSEEGRTKVQGECERIVEYLKKGDIEELVKGDIKELTE